MTPIDLLDLRPHQIFYLEQDSSRLYGELIQWIAERDLCWLRPIALCCLPQGAATAFTDALADRTAILYDLSLGSDVICPDSLLHLALDTEVLPLLAELHRLKAELAPQQNAHRLRLFIQQLWQADPEAFQRSAV